IHRVARLPRRLLFRPHLALLLFGSLSLISGWLWFGTGLFLGRGSGLTVWACSFVATVIAALTLLRRRLQLGGLLVLVVTRVDVISATGFWPRSFSIPSSTWLRAATTSTFSPRSSSACWPGSATVRCSPPWHSERRRPSSRSPCFFSRCSPCWCGVVRARSAGRRPGS